MISKKKDKKLKVIISFHETLPCYQAESLKKYLLARYNLDILFIGHPLLDIAESFKRSSRFEYYRNNQLIKSKKAFHWIFPKPFLFMKDMIYTFLWSISYRDKWDIFVGVDNISVLVALLLKRLGKVRKVVYHTIDYYPTRFENKILNWLYFQIDKLCVKLSDETWNVNGIMAQAREDKMGMVRSVYNKQYEVPMCVWVNKVKRLPFSKININKIVFRGSLVNEMGVDLIIKAMPKIVKSNPQAILEIYGDGEARTNLEQLSRKLQVDNHVKFHGWIRERKKLEELMSDGAVGIATFNTKILDERVRNSDPSKIKDYTLMGMPVITTNALSTSGDILKFKCGFLIDYDSNQLADTIIKLLSNKKLLSEYRKNALSYIQQYDCEYIFNKNVTRVVGSLY